MGLARWCRVLVVSHVLVALISLVPMIFGAFLFVEDAGSSGDMYHGLGMVFGGLAFASGLVPLVLVLVLRWWLRTGTERAAAGDPGRLRAAGVAHVVGAGVPLVLLAASSLAGTVLGSNDPILGVLHSLLGVVSLVWCVLMAVAGWKVRRLAGAAPV